MPKQGEVDGCGTGVILAIAAAALVMLLSFGGGSVLAEERGPECHTTQTVLVACGDDKATIDWTAGNYWGKPLLLQVVMGGQATMVPLDNGQTTSGTFETGLATLPAGEVWFVWADSRGSWTEKVAYDAHSCAPTALTLTSFSAKRFGPVAVRAACIRAGRLLVCADCASRHEALSRPSEVRWTDTR